MFHVLKRLTISLLILSFLVLPVFASDPQSERLYYMTVTTSQLGEVTICFPSNTNLSLATDQFGVPFNTSSSAVTGYVYTSGWPDQYDYQVQFSAYGTVNNGTTYNTCYARYRPYSSSGYGATYSELTITEVVDTNLDLSSPQFLSTTFYVCCLAALGVIIFFLIVKRRR